MFTVQTYCTALPLVFRIVLPKTVVFTVSLDYNACFLLTEIHYICHQQY